MGGGDKWGGGGGKGIGQDTRISAQYTRYVGSALKRQRRWKTKNKKLKVSNREKNDFMIGCLRRVIYIYIYIYNIYIYIFKSRGFTDRLLSEMCRVKYVSWAGMHFSPFSSKVSRNLLLVLHFHSVHSVTG